MEMPTIVRNTWTVKFHEAIADLVANVPVDHLVEELDRSAKSVQDAADYARERGA